MSKIWEWFSGKKTLIGLAMLALIGQNWFWEVIPNGAFENFLMGFFGWIGALLTGTGVAHKIDKQVEENKVEKREKEILM